MTLNHKKIVMAGHLTRPPSGRASARSKDFEVLQMRALSRRGMGGRVKSPAMTTYFNGHDELFVPSRVFLLTGLCGFYIVLFIQSSAFA